VKLIGLSILALGAIGTVALALSTEPATTPVTADTAKASTYWAEKDAAQTKADTEYQESLKVQIHFPDDRPLRVLITGDSLAGAYFASTKEKGFTQLVNAELSRHGEVELVQATQSGGTLSKVGGIVSVPSGLDLAIIELGTNDIATKTSAEDFAKQYDSLLGKIKAESPNVQVLCVSVWSDTSATTAGMYNKVVEERCATVGGKYVEISSLYNTTANRGPEGVPTWVGTSDAFHPNDVGHKAIADRILERIKVS
jgi:lysophospholipase L1-like esterase